MVILCLHAGPAADIKVFGLKVGVVQLLWSLWMAKHREERKQSKVTEDEKRIKRARYRGWGEATRKGEGKERKMDQGRKYSLS